MRHGMKALGVVGGAMLMAGAWSVAGAEPLFTVTDLGALPSSWASFSQPEAINNVGQIVGFSIAGDSTRAFLWSSATGMQDLGDLAGGRDYSRAFGINDAGEVVGTSGSATGDRAFLWSGATGMRSLGAPLVRAYDINNAGQIVGSSHVGSAFLWDTTNGVQDLGDFPGEYDDGTARSINDSGQVAGYANLDNGYHAFLWDSENGMENLGDLPGGVDRSYGLGINAAGEVVGYSHASQAGRPNGERAFLWDSVNGMQNLGTLPDSYGSYALDINNRRQVVGYSSGSNWTRAILWDSGALHDLNQLVDPTDEFKPYVSLVLANSINDNGWIAATGVDSRTGNTHAYLLIPSTTALLQRLADEVLGVGPGKSLSAKVELAQTYFAVPDVQATCAVLIGFVNQVTAQRGKKIPMELAEDLTAAAEAIMTDIGCN